MKRKRDYHQMMGDDGELLVPYSADVRKRKIHLDHADQNQIMLRWLAVAIVFSLVLLMSGFIIWATEPEPLSPLPTLVSMPFMGTPLQQTLPPTWTPAPTTTQPPTVTRVPASPTATMTPSTTPPEPTPPPEVISYRVEVRGRGEWQSGTSLLQAGDVVTVEYIEGQWKPWKESPWTAASGSGIYRCGDVNDCGAPVPEQTWGALIARVGEDDPFYVGLYSRFIASTDGELAFRMNDTDTTDNEGSLILNISIERYPSSGTDSG
jgi:hypothetical protein